MAPPSTVLSGTVDALGRAAASDEILTKEGVGRYGELLGNLASAAVREGLAGLHDVCMVFQDILSRDQGGGPELTEEELERLQVWPGLVAAYVAAPHDAETIDCLLAGLQGPRWRAELEDGAMEMLKALLAAPSQGAVPEQVDTDLLPADLFDIGEEGPAAPPVDGLPMELDGDVLSALLDGEAEAEASNAQHSEDPSEALATALTSLPGLGERADAEDSAWLGHYAEQVAGLAEAAVQAGHAGLHEISLLFQAALLGLQERGEEVNADQRRAVERWPELVQGYLAATSSGEALVDHLRAIDAGIDLSPEDVQMLCALLDIGAGETEEGPVRDTVADIADVIDGADADPVAPSAATSTGGGREFDELPDAVRELVEILLGELPQMEASIATVQESHGDASGEEGTRHGLQGYAKQLARYGAAAETVGFPGLHQVCLYTRDNVLAIAQVGHDTTDAELGLLQDWVGHVRNYLHMPLAPSVGQALASFLTSADWPQALSSEASQALATLLGAFEIESVVEEGESRQAQATPEDVSLALPDDVDQALLDGMLQELPGQTEAFSAAIQRLTTGGSLEDVEVAQRIAHTLKGAGNTVGIRGIAHLTHQIEDILLSFSKQKALPTPSLAQSLMRAADCLEAMSEALLGSGSPPEDAPTVLQGILDWANRIDREGIPREDDTQILGVTAPQGIDRGPGESQRPPGLTPGGAAPMMRVPAGLVDELLRLVGETIILTGQVHERLRRTAKQAQAMRGTFSVLQQLGQELEELIDVKDLSSEQQRRDSQFDSLELDQYNEIHTYSRRLVEAATDAREMGFTVMDYLAQLDDMLVSQERLNRESQESVLHTRMVPTKSIFPRLQRSVRQTCRLTGKQAELTTSGGETMMDSEVLNGVVDPLMHVLRNAIDHGIEPTEARSAAGKDPLGHVTLDFLREGNNILVRCRDDGAGLDFEAIRRGAEERGILNPDLEASEEELKRLILKPNFSTRSQATQTSGRGIGLDAVYSRTVELGGSLTVQSEAGEGCAVELRLPLSLISSHALLVRVGQQVVAVANRGVEQIVAPGSGKVRPFGDDLILHAGEDTHPVRSLESMLEITTDHAEGELEARPALMVQGETGLTAVLVEAVLDSRDLVVKGLGDYIPKLRGILGATILGDGSVTPVLDLSELLRTPHRARTAERPDVQPVLQESRSLPIALVVDDSLSARRSLAQFMEDSGFVVRTARDGVEAVQAIESMSPDIVLADLEMPRMNGMELTTHIRSQDSTAALPVIMVTSRSTDKHRRQAQQAGVNVYLTKPFSEDELLAHVHALQEKR